MLNLISRMLHKIGRVAISSAVFISRVGKGDNLISRVNGIDNIIYTDISEIKPLLISFNESKPPNVVLLIPSLISSSFFGGVATALIVAAKLAIFSKRDLLIVQTVVSGISDNNSLNIFYKRNGIDITSIKIAIIDIANRDGIHTNHTFSVNNLDIFVASAWGDAYLVNKLKLSTKFLYLVQDYEPIFYANSDRFVLAENTYYYDSFIPVCNTKLMHLHMLQKGYDNFAKFPYWFEPAVSNKDSGLITRNSKRNIFLYGRPAVPRNLFYLAIMALQYIFKNELLKPGEWNVFMAGQDNLPILELVDGYSITNLGKMDVDDYIKFSKSIDLAIALMMAPHPNYPTLEFASIGSAVVTTKYGVKDDLSFYSKNIFAADLDISSIVENILRAAELPYKERINNLSSNNIGSDWNVALDTLIQGILPEFE